MTWWLYSQHRDTLQIVQYAGFVPESVCTWAEDLTSSCIENLEMKKMLFVTAQNVRLYIGRPEMYEDGALE
jgi:hypothetical protein